VYLTELHLNPRRRGAVRLLASPQRMHAAVLAGFPNPPGAATGRVLWRVDEHPHRTTLYVVSPSVPDLTHVVEEAGWPTTETWRSADYEPFLGRLRLGQQWAFRFCGNPVHKVKVSASEADTTVRAHVSERHQLAWFTERAARWGFGVEEDDGAAPRIIGRTTRRFRRGPETVTLAQATFGGRLTVTDREAFVDALRTGMGRGKAYGCGLMTLAPTGT